MSGEQTCDNVAAVSVRSGDLLGPRRPSKRDDFTRGFVCAVAKLVEMHGRGTEPDELFRLAGKPEWIIQHADEYDIETLRDAGLLCPNK